MYIRLFLLSCLLIMSMNSHALSPEIRYDMLQTKLAGQLKAKNYSASLSTIREIKSMGRRLPKSFDYFEAKALFESGQKTRAAKLFERYVNNTGKKGKYYRQSLAYLIKAEEAAKPHMIKVPSGCFQMGSNSGYYFEQPVHRVCVGSFMLGKYEVTQNQWQAVMGDNPSKFKNCGGECPVERVSWHDVQTFIQRLNNQTGEHYRLPTEAEWEYACRSGGRNQKYCGGSNPDSVAWYEGNSGKTTHPVGQKRANGLELYDMSGNVYEWVQDWYNRSYYNNSPKNNPAGASGGSSRVNRGGSWRYGASSQRSASRNGYDPGVRNSDIGFRLARSL